MLTGMTLLHYSAKPLCEVRSVEQRADPDIKPRGLWFSVENPGTDEWMGWREWCESEQWGLRSLVNAVEISFVPSARVLMLSTPEDIETFNGEYEKPLFGDYRMIDWRAVADKYQAIIISPYQWSRRFDDKARWYYGWDCASGCVWDASAVTLGTGSAALSDPQEKP